MAVDASGGFVATGSADRSIKVTDLAGGFVTHHFTGHEGIVLRVLFHPRQLMLFSACDQGEVRAWDLVTKAPAFQLQKAHMSAVPALSLAPDGWHLLSGGRDRVVVVWDVRTGSRVATIPVYESLEGLAVLPTGSAFPGVLSVAALTQQGLTGKAHFFATAGERGVVRIWRSDTGTCVYTHHGSSSSSSMLQAGSGSSKKKGKKGAADASGGAAPAAPAGSELLELLLLPGGRSLLAATGDARLLFFQPAAASVAPAAAAGSTAASSSELVLTRQLVGSNDEVTDLAFLYASDSSSGSSSSSTADADAGALVLAPSEPRRLAVATNSHDIRVFDLRDASCLGGCVGHSDIVLCLDTFREGGSSSSSGSSPVELLASGSKDAEVRVWDAASCRCLAVAAGHVGAVTSVAWSQSKSKGGQYMASGGADKLLKLWDTSKLLQQQQDGEQQQPSAAAPLALSTLAAVAAHDKDVNALAFSPNDSLLATASQDRTIKLWRLPSLVLAATLRGHKRGVWDVAFSPAEQVLLSCSGDKLLKLWSVTDGTCLRTFEGHTGGVLRCSFLTAGTQVLSAGADGLLKLWDTRTGASLATFEGHEDRLWGLAASGGPSESLLATGGGDARIVVWRDVTADKAAEAEAEEESLVLRQQELSNALADGDYPTAARLAFQLRHPGRLLEVLRRQPGGPTAALAALQGLVANLDQADLATALGYCREWNTNSRNAHLAQALLRAVLSRHTPEQILGVPGSRELLGGLLAYSERHAARLGRLQRSTFLLDFTLAAGQVLLPADAHDAAEAAAAAAADADAEAAAGAAPPHVGADPGANGLANGLQQQRQANGHANGMLSGSDSSDDDDSGDDSDSDADGDAALLSGSQERDEHEDGGSDEGGAGEAERPDPMLPGWGGGGDDLSDDWAGPDSDAQEASEGGDADICWGSSSDDGSDDDDDAGAAGSSSGSEQDDEGGSSSGEDADEEEPQQQPQQVEVRQLRGSTRLRAQQQPQQPQASARPPRQQQQPAKQQQRPGRRTAAVAAPAAPAAAVGSKRKAAAAATADVAVTGGGRRGRAAAAGAGAAVPAVGGVAKRVTRSRRAT